MHDDHAAAVANVGFEGVFERCGPGGGVVIQNDGAVLREIRMEGGEAGVRGRSGHHGHLKETGVFQFLFENRRGLLPGVVGSGALAIEKHHRDRRGSGSCAGQRQNREE